MNYKNKKSLLGLLMGFLVFFSYPIFANFSYEGYLTDTAGSSIASQTVQIKLQIQNPSGCSLYEETQAVVTGVDGYFSVLVGTGTQSANNSTPFSEIFVNQGTLAVSGCNYTPQSGDNRKMAVSISNDSGATWDSLGVLELNPVPFASAASVAESIGEFGPENLLRVVANGYPAAAPALTSTDVVELQNLIAGTSTKYMTRNNSVGASLPVVATSPTGAAEGSIWYDSTNNVIKFKDSTTIRELGTAGAGIQGIIAGSGITTSGTSTVTINVDVGTGSSQIVQLQNVGGVAKLPAVDGSQLTNITASSIGGTSVSVTSPTAAGQVLRFNGSSQYVPEFLSLADIRSTASPGSTIFPATSCSASQSLSWSSLTDSFACSSITGLDAASTFSSGVLPVARGGTGLSSLGDGIVYASSSPAFSTLSNGSSGDVLTSNGPGTAPSWQAGFTGTGTASYIPYFSAANSLGNSPLFVSGGNVGVGTTTPANKLDVVGTINVNAASMTYGVYTSGSMFGFYGVASTTGVYGAATSNNSNGVKGSASALTSNGVLGENSSSDSGAGIYGKKIAASNSGAAVQAENNSATGWGFFSSGTSPNYFQGNVGIGTAAPTAALEVAGVIKITGGTPAAGRVLTSDATGGATWQTPSASLSGNTSSTITTLGDGATNTGTYTTVIGNNVHGTGTGLVIVGGSASTNYTGNQSTVIGYQAGATGGAPTYDYNVLIGSNSSASGSPVNYAVALGSGASVTGTGGVALGSGASAPANTVVIGSHNGSTFQERMRIDSTGNMGVGTAAPVASLDVVKDISGGSTEARVFNSNTNGTARVIVGASSTVGAGSLSIETHSPASTWGTGQNGSEDARSQAGATIWWSGTTGGALSMASATSLRFYTGVGASNPVASFERMKIDGSGNVGIGLTNPTYQLQLSTDSAAKPGTSTWTIASDERLKDIRAPFTRGLEALDGLHAIYFNYKQDNPLDLPSNKEFVGIKAQDALKVIPEAVSQDDKGFYHVTNDSIIWTAINAIKELYHKVLGHDEWLSTQSREIASVKAEKADKSEVDELKADNAAKDKKIKELEQRLEKIEKAFSSK